MSLLGFTPLAGAGTPVNWSTAIDGNWNQALNWSPNVVPNNGQPAGSTYDATIAATGAPYTVSLSSGIGIDSLTLNSNDATLTHSGGTLTAGNVNLLAGTYSLQGGMLSAPVSGPGMLTGNGTLNDVALGSGLVINSGNSIHFRSALTLAAGGEVRMNGGSSNAALLGEDDAALSGVGEIVLDGTQPGMTPTNLILPIIRQNYSTLTIGPGILIRTGTGGGLLGSESASERLVNQGLVWARTEGRSIELRGYWTNQGTLRVSAGKLILNGTYSPTNLGSIEHLGGEVILAGTFQNSGNTLMLTPQTGVWIFKGLTQGGAIGSSGGMTPVFSGAAIRDVQMLGDFTVDSGDLVVSGSTSLGAGLVRLINGGLIFNNPPPHAIDGVELVFDGGSLAKLATEHATLDLGPNTIVRTGASGGQVNASVDQGITNRGVISARTAGKTLSMTNVVNLGRVEAINGGSLVWDAASGDLGTLTLGNGSLMQISGRFLLSKPVTVPAGATLSLLGGGTNASSITVNGGTLKLGGPLTTAGPTIGAVSLNNASLVLGGKYSTSDFSTVTIANSSITLEGSFNEGSGQTLLISASVPWYLAGGSVYGIVNTPDNTALVVTGTGSLHGTINAPVVVKPGAALLCNGAPTLNAPLSIESGGLVEVYSLSGTLNVNNAGTLKLTHGSTVTLAGNWANSGTFDVAGGTLILSGTPASLGNIVASGTSTIGIALSMPSSALGSLTLGTATTLAVLPGGEVVNSNASWLTPVTVKLAGGVVRGGTVLGTTQSVGMIASGSNVGTLDAVTLNLPVQVQNSLKIINGVTINRSLTFTGSTGLPMLMLDGNQTISGTGEIVSTSSSQQVRIQGSNGVLTIGPGLTVRSAANLVTLNAPQLLNQGTLRAQSLSIIIVAQSFTNSATLEAMDTGRMTIWAPLSGSGSISIAAGGTLTCNGGRQDTLTLAGSAALRSKGSGGATLALANLSIAGAPGAWTGKLDLADNALVLDYSAASPLATARDQIIAGWNGGAGNGNGITTSSSLAGRALGYGEASDLLGLSGSQTALWQGQTVDATSVLVRYTLAGDADLSGSVDFPDLTALAAHYGSAGLWSEGDFNHDGQVNFFDLTALSSNYGNVLAGAVPTGAVDFSADLAAAFASVPEPGGALPLAAWGLALARGRGRRRG